jgi:hypothetical protein
VGLRAFRIVFEQRRIRKKVMRRSARIAKAFAKTVTALLPKRKSPLVSDFRLRNFFPTRVIRDHFRKKNKKKLAMLSLIG